MAKKLELSKRVDGLTTHPEAPAREEAAQAAAELAENLRIVYTECRVRVQESIRSRFEVVVEVPFRTEHRPWVLEKEA